MRRYSHEAISCDSHALWTKSKLSRQENKPDKDKKEKVEDPAAQSSRKFSITNLIRKLSSSNSNHTTMATRHHVEGYDNFCEFMKNFDCKDKEVFVYFSGSKVDGVSWCSDCVRAQPIIEEALKKLDPKMHFIYVEVGDRPTWKDTNCPFRKDPKTKLMVVPTLVKWGCPQKLEGEQCEKPELLELIFSDEEF